MSKTRTKQVLIGVGFPVLLTDIGLAGSGYSLWVTKHPSLLWIVGGVSGILTLMGLFLPREQERDTPQPVVVNNNKQEIGNVAGGSASAAGGSASATGNQMTVNFNSVPAFAPAEASQASPKTPPVDGRNAVPKLGLSFVQPEVFQDNGVFRFARPGFGHSNGHSLCILVKNAPAAQGEYAAIAHNIFSVLQFTSPTSAGRTTHVGRAFWMLHEDNEITISLGDTAHILIGFPEGDEWVAFHNPNEPVKGRTNFRAAAEWDRDLKEPEKRPFDWYDGATFDVDVRIVSSSSGQTLAHRQFLFVRNGIGYSAKWRNSDQVSVAERRPDPEPPRREVLSESASLDKDDPCIVVEFIDERLNQLHKKTALLLRNTGGREALDVQIETISLRGQKIQFPRIAGAIRSQNYERFDPVMDGRWGAVNTALFIDSLMKEWNSHNDISMKELSIPLKCIYKNFARNALFETSCVLVFSPNEERLNRMFRDRTGNLKPIIHFRDYVHKKIPM